MNKESSMFSVWDGDKLVDLIIYCPTAAYPQPTKLEEELVRIFNENKRLSDWINWLQDEAVVNFDDNRVGLFRRIKEGLTVKQALKGEIEMKDEMVWFHGGCCDCTQQSIHGVDFCFNCQFFDAEWSKPNLNNRPPRLHGVIREQVKQRKEGIKNYRAI